MDLHSKTMPKVVATKMLSASSIHPKMQIELGKTRYTVWNSYCLIDISFIIQSNLCLQTLPILDISCKQQGFIFSQLPPMFATCEQLSHWWLHAKQTLLLLYCFLWCTYSSPPALLKSTATSSEKETPDADTSHAHSNLSSETLFITYCKRAPPVDRHLHVGLSQGCCLLS